ESASEDFIKPGALFREEARVLLVSLWACKIDLLVRGIDVAHNNDLKALSAPPRAVLKERIIEAKLVIKPFWTTAAVREIHVYNKRFSVCCNDDTPLRVKLLYADPILNKVRLFLCIQSGSTVALFKGM